LRETGIEIIESKAIVLSPLTILVKKLNSYGIVCRKRDKFLHSKCKIPKFKTKIPGSIVEQALGFEFYYEIVKSNLKLFLIITKSTFCAFG
jgi:hypothetical protein